MNRTLGEFEIPVIPADIPTAAVGVDWSRFDALTDEDIQRGIDEDPDAAPFCDDAWFASATVVMPRGLGPKVRA